MIISETTYSCHNEGEAPGFKLLVMSHDSKSEAREYVKHLHEVLPYPITNFCTPEKYFQDNSVCGLVWSSYAYWDYVDGYREY